MYPPNRFSGYGNENCRHPERTRQSPSSILDLTESQALSTICDGTRRRICTEKTLNAPEPLQRPLQCADGAMRKNSALDSAHVPGVFSLLSEQPHRIIHYRGI